MICQRSGHSDRKWLFHYEAFKDSVQAVGPTCKYGQLKMDCCRANTILSFPLACTDGLAS